MPRDERPNELIDVEDQAKRDLTSDVEYPPAARALP